MQGLSNGFLREATNFINMLAEMSSTPRRVLISAYFPVLGELN